MRMELSERKDTTRRIQYYFHWHNHLLQRFSVLASSPCRPHSFA